MESIINRNLFVFLLFFILSLFSLKAQLIFEIPKEVYQEEVYQEEVPVDEVPPLNSADLLIPEPLSFEAGKSQEKGFHFFYDYNFLNFLVPLNLTHVNSPGLRGTEQGIEFFYSYELISNRFRMESEILKGEEKLLHGFKYNHYFTGPRIGTQWQYTWSPEGQGEGFFLLDFLYESYKKSFQGELRAEKSLERVEYSGDFQVRYTRDFLLDIWVHPVFIPGAEPDFNGHISLGWQWGRFRFMPGLQRKSIVTPYGDISYEFNGFTLGAGGDGDENLFIYWKKKQRDLSFKSGIKISEETREPFVLFYEDFFPGVRKYYLSRDAQQWDFSFINPVIQSIITLSLSRGTENYGELSLEWNPGEHISVQTGVRWLMDIQKINYNIEISFSS